MNHDSAGKKIVVVIPCYNEEKAIKKVINDFQKELPGAEIIVFDNNSSDETGKIAAQEGAKVISEKRQGKGWVVRSIFEKVEADACVMVDGDDTYSAHDAHALLEPVLKGKADMAVGNRLSRDNSAAIRPLHQFGNWVITKTINFIFRAGYKDVLSGFRVFSREFMQNIPLITTGFEIETELTLQALEHGYIVKEIPICYRNRPAGSISKLSSFIDGYQIMVTITMLLRDHKPQHFFSAIFIVLSLFSVFWIKSGYIAVGMIILAVAFLFFATGLILSAINTRFAELRSIIKRKHNE